MATFDFTIVDNNKLNEDDDFRDVTKEICSLRADFYSIGKELGLRPSDLDAIKDNSSLNAERKLDEVILLWLRERYNVAKWGIPTWRKLVQAIHAIRPAVANLIIQKHKLSVGIQNQCSSGASPDKQETILTSSESGVFFREPRKFNFKTKCKDTFTALKQKGLGKFRRAHSPPPVDNGIIEEKIHVGMQSSFKKPPRPLLPPQYSTVCDAAITIPHPQLGPCTRLENQQHIVIYHKLAHYAIRWKEFGEALGFRCNELKVIQNDALLLEIDDCKGYLYKMLSQWLQWSPGDGRGSSDFANTIDLYRALITIGLEPVAYEIDTLLHKK